MTAAPHRSMTPHVPPPTLTMCPSSPGVPVRGRVVRPRGSCPAASPTATTECIRCPAKRYVARFGCRRAVDLLAIDRDAETPTRRVAADNRGRPRRRRRTTRQHGVLLIEWIDGPDLHRRRPRRQRQLCPGSPTTCRPLHAGPRFATDFDMFACSAATSTIVQDARVSGCRTPTSTSCRRFVRSSAALHVRGEATVPCHNDLLAANIMDDGDRLWFIDYEYSGNNDAVLRARQHLRASRTCSTDRLDRAGHGATTAPRRRRKVARARLFGLMSDYGWTLWASIQDADQRARLRLLAWGMEKYERALAEFRGPELQRPHHRSPANREHTREPCQ